MQSTSGTTYRDVKHGVKGDVCMYSFPSGSWTQLQKLEPTRISCHSSICYYSVHSFIFGLLLGVEWPECYPLNLEHRMTLKRKRTPSIPSNSVPSLSHTHFRELFYRSATENASQILHNNSRKMCFQITFIAC